MTAWTGVRVLRGRSRLVVGLDGNVDFGHGASLDPAHRPGVAREAVLEAESCRQALELLDVGGIGRKPGQACANDSAALPDPAEQQLEIRNAGAPRFRHEHRELARLEDVAV